MINDEDQDRSSTMPAGGQQHGSSSGEGGNVGPPSDKPDGGTHHPRPNVPGSRVEDQADQPGAAD